MAFKDKNELMITFTLSLAIFVFFVPALPAGELQRFQVPQKPDGSLTFLVVGDWGRKGYFNQSEVAKQMGVIGKRLDIDFVISTGDNFYEDGLTGVDDPAFFESFSNVYTSSSLQKRWYNVLGNHDYRGDVEAQLSPLLTSKDARWLCLRSYVLDGGIVEFYFVDTTPFVDEYFTRPGKSTYDWRGVLPTRQAYLKNMIQDIDRALGSSTAVWKFVVGHHTILSAGQHGVTSEVEQQLVPILEKNRVDMYINGHDHCLQRIVSSISGIQYITSGGGSKAWRGIMNSWNKEELKFYFDGQGFMSVKMTATKGEFLFHDAFGSVLHAWNVSKESRPEPFSL